MGQWFKFACSDCDYTAEVSGGPDAGMQVTVRTMTCSDCRELVDVVTNVRDFASERLEAEIGLCPTCRGRNVTPWGQSKHDLSSFLEPRVGLDQDDQNWGPCPRCGQAVRRGESTAIWD